MRYILILILFIFPHVVLCQDISENKIVYVQSESVPVYNDTTEAKVVDTRSISQGVFVLKAFKNWAYIRYSDGKIVQGYIKRSHLDIDRPSANKRQRLREERLAKIQKRKEALHDLLKTIEAGKLKIGTSANMIKDRWGIPDNTSTVIDANGKSEQWVYGISEKIYLHFQNRKLISIRY